MFVCFCPVAGRFHLDREACLRPVIRDHITDGLQVSQVDAECVRARRPPDIVMTRRLDRRPDAILLTEENSLLDIGFNLKQ